MTPAWLAAELDIPYTQRTFSDIGDSPFRREINTLAAYRLVSGYEDGSFHPEQTITRAEFCAMLSAALDLPAPQKAPAFSDVKAYDWYADAVAAMAAQGCIAGFGDGSFRPDDTITYEQMVTILSSVAAWCSMEGYELAQEGVPIGEWLDYYHFSEWAQTPARALNKLGALVGGLAPTDPADRQTAAGMLCTLMENIHLLWD